MTVNYLYLCSTFFLCRLQRNCVWRSSRVQSFPSCAAFSLPPPHPRSVSMQLYSSGIDTTVCGILASSSSPQIRQYAAILLRYRIQLCAAFSPPPPPLRSVSMQPYSSGIEYSCVRHSRFLLLPPRSVNMQPYSSGIEYNCVRHSRFLLLPPDSSVCSHTPQV